MAPPRNSSTATGVSLGPDLAALLARVEAAEGADRELDAAVCVALGIMPVITTWPPDMADGWSWELRVSEDGQKVETWAAHPTDKHSPNLLYGRSPEPFTASLDAALALCGRIRETADLHGHPLDLLNDAIEYLLVEHGWKPNQALAPQLAMAVVVALLRALIAQGEDGTADRSAEHRDDQP